ncbi:glycoside hydrolase family 5 protein [Antribacter gilvus]|uniref:glycoside hydrolase family 5 protein n=1 Tax=Antribacter gilvus TaxID=2304675 RepID=UPI000F782DF9|nr:glycoside hydrolase family 5 protein [Antribacter gilvus]
MAVSVPPRPLTTQGSKFVDGFGDAVRLRGICLGGWLNMENFITGYAANESLMRRTVADVLGAERADRFFERLLSEFFSEDDARFLGENGFNLVRIPVNYRHLQHDDAPFEVDQDGFRHLDRAIEALGRHGVYSIIDLHALPGSQNQHWHSDNDTHVAKFWTHREFQDRVDVLWRAIAEHYRGNVRVAGYNLMNEPADPTGRVVGPVYDRLLATVREVDPDHIVFLDGNTYSTDFSMFTEPAPNTVYTLHDYVPAGLGRSSEYSKDLALAKFLERSEFARSTGTPILVGEFGPIYTGDEAVDAVRRQILADQLDIYRDHDASWTAWTYKDVGVQGLLTVSPASPYLQHFGDFMAKKKRLAADQWGTDGIGEREATQPFQDLVAREFPSFDPYPWGRFDWVRTLIINLGLAQPLAHEYAELFRGLDDEQLEAFVTSFSFAACDVRATLLDQLREG